MTLLYACNVEVPADATPGLYPLVINNAAATDPDGNALPIITRDDVISVPELPKSGMLFVDTVEGHPGERVWVDARLEATVAAQVIGVITGFEYGPWTQVVDNGLGEPHCLVKGLFPAERAFYFSPPVCVERDNCTGVYVDFTVDEDPDTAVPSGSVMFSCLVAIAEAAPPGTYPLPCQNIRIVTYDTGFIDSHCNGGAIRVLGPDVPTHTPTATVTPSVEPSSTPTSPPASTPTVAPSRTARPSDDSGCTIAAPTASSPWWLLSAPLVAALSRGRGRRRPRRARR